MCCCGGFRWRWEPAGPMPAAAQPRGASPQSCAGPKPKPQPSWKLSRTSGQNSCASPPTAKPCSKPPRIRDIAAPVPAFARNGIPEQAVLCPRPSCLELREQLLDAIFFLQRGEAIVHIVGSDLGLGLAH